jgi:hypothetical protein
VRLGRPQSLKGRRVRIPVIVDSGRDYRALELELRFDAAQARLRRVRRADATANAILQANIDRSGRAIVAVASGRPLPRSRRPALWIEMDRPRRARSTDFVHVRWATVDDTPAALD